jgi:hypothetical protein
MSAFGVETLEKRVLFSAAISFAAPQVYPSGAPAHHLAFGDFTNDGFEDIAVPNPANNSITILINNGAGGFTAARPVAVDSPIDVVAGDFTGDGKVDLAVLSNVVPSTRSINLAGANNSVTSLVIFDGNGDGTFTRGLTYRIQLGSGKIVSADFNHDGLPDIALSVDHTVAVLINQGNGIFAKPIRYRVTPGSISYLTTGDFSGNGNEDLVVALPSQHSFRVLLNNGSGQFTVERGVPLGIEPIWLAVGDFNGDGTDDVAAVDGQYRSGIFVRMSNGNGTFSKTPLVTDEGAFLQSIVAGVFAGNGIADLAVVDFTSTLRVVPGNDNGTFGTSFPLAAGPEAFGIFTADLTSSPLPDLVMLRGGMVYVYLNTST